MAGIFITIEGPDGAGKTSMIQELVPRLEETLTCSVMTTREPGGIPISEEIREVILNPRHITMDERTEALLYAAARRQHLVEKILPALEADKLVLCDRFVDSSLAYQGVGRRIGMEEIAEINHFATEGITPHLTLYLDVDSETGLRRIQKGRSLSEINRLDNEDLVFHQRVRHAYLDLAEKYPDRIITIDAKQSLEKVVEKAYSEIMTYLTQNERMGRR
ncbi:dTMP kinase [Vagococcus lutrae]|uniref:dTMP kinase n=1 Tax=Vagococcus lutrae TaxID=81947 RepID=UPI002890445D|nr:dTMP kinase [Vagococcus lutrae]MDT2808559.1 dTMP kinase [Vagococcus lutrae]